MNNQGERISLSCLFNGRNHLQMVAMWFCVLLFCTAPLVQSVAQTPFPPPKVIKVYTMQGLSFGNFYTGATGGTVVISPEGGRSVTGTVVQAGGLVHHAIFVVELLPGRQVSISLGPDVTLTRTVGGGSMTMSVGPTDKGLGFVTSGGHPFFNPVQVGGTLYVGNIGANPPGNYQGTFSVTFIQE
ncbi:MAG: DUF4402 domain-containing protein [Bacteroidales bacterium]|nr:DUF4402 domain-containing protein [Bacteroidales bacterium]